MRRRILLFLGVVATTLSLWLSGSSAQAAVSLSATNYVAMGDSFASGTGLGSYLTGSGSCHRSSLAYPVVLAGGSTKVTFVACNGATTDTVMASQTPSMPNSAVTYVSLTIGGNDVGFVPVITKCLTGSVDCDKDTAITSDVDAHLTQLPSQIANVLSKARTAYPTARIVITGYPQLFQNTGTGKCNVGSLMSLAKSETTYLDNAAVRINEAINTGIATFNDSNVRFVDVVTAGKPGSFQGHGLCTSTTTSNKWINALNILSTLGAFHPNKNGHSLGYKVAVSAALNAA